MKVIIQRLSDEKSETINNVTKIVFGFENGKAGLWLDSIQLVDGKAHFPNTDFRLLHVWQ